MGKVDPLGAVGIYVDVGVQYCDLLLSFVRDTKDTTLQDSNVLLGDYTWLCASLVADLEDQRRSNSITNKRLTRLLYAGTFSIDPFSENYGLPAAPSTEVPIIGMAKTFLSASQEPMSFGKRFLNLMLREVARVTANVVMLRPYNRLRSDFDLEGSIFQSIHRQANLILAPLVWGVEPPRCLPPNWKPIRPVLPRPPKALPESIDQWMQEYCSDEQGIVVVCFGTQATLSQEQTDRIYEALSSLSQEFCFVWHLPALRAPRPAGLDKDGHNPILTLPWLPQNDLMGHSRTVAFVSHVGYGSLYEAAYHGTPIVGLPIFGDQEDNAARPVYEGWGVNLDSRRFTAEELVHAIRTVGNKDSPMQLAAKSISALVKEGGPGTDQVVDWMEYVSKHGVEHLVPFRSMNASYVTCYNLDVEATMVVLLWLFVYGAWLVVRRLMWRRPPLPSPAKEKRA